MEFYHNAIVLRREITMLLLRDFGIKGKFVLSYNDCGYIRELYEGYTIIEVDRLHNLVQKEVKPRYRELIIKNFV